MATLATTKMSSKGQVVIPEEVRTRMKLKAGAPLTTAREQALTPQSAPKSTSAGPVGPGDSLPSA